MKKSKTNCDLKSCFLCKLCLPDWIPAIDAHRKNFEVKKGELLFVEGEPVHGIYFIYSGNAKVHKKWGPDKEHIVRFAKQGAIIGHRGLGTNPVYPASATALEPCKVCYIEMDFFESTLKVNPELTYTLMLFFADELREAERKMRNLAHMSVKGRVATSLLILKKQFGLDEENFIGIDLTRQDLASFSGATYETVFRVMNELILENAIAVAGKSIQILNEVKLIELTELQDN